jgi:phosphatidylglycerophosphatase A
MRTRDYPILFLASGLGSGFLRPYAGTWGSIPPLIIGWFVRSYAPFWVFSVVTAGVVALSVFCAGYAEKVWGNDAKRITIDEFAGMLITLMGLPVDITVYVIAFFAFRVFDVLKPPPVRQLESLPGGWGVTADDVAAGVYANLLMRLLLLTVL